MRGVLRVWCPQDPAFSIHPYVSSCLQCIHGLMSRDRTSPRSRATVTPALASAWYLVGSAGVLPQSDTETFLWAKKTVEGDLAKAMYAVAYFLEVGIGTFTDPKQCMQGHPAETRTLTYHQSARILQASC